MLRHYVSAKIQHLRVTDKSLAYNGSMTIPRKLMAMVGIKPYEKVQIVNMSNGMRWETYAIEGDDNQVSLNGGAARLGEIGDTLIVICYRIEERFSGAKVVFCNEHNQPCKELNYEAQAQGT